MFTAKPRTIGQMLQRQAGSLCSPFRHSFPLFVHSLDWPSAPGKTGGRERCSNLSGIYGICALKQVLMAHLTCAEIFVTVSCD